MVNYPKDWGEINLGDSLSYTQPNKYVSNVMQDKGKNPVLTAGKSFVLGYSNETNIYENIPVILFDDFTTEVRYIDFKFLVRSSATKFLSLKNEENNLKFLYYKLANLNYVIESHERHWIKKFASFSMKVPKIEEQNKVVEVISYFDKHIENLSKLIEKKKMIRDGAVEDLVSGEKRLSNFSGKWDYKPVKSIIKDVITGGTPSTNIKEYWGGSVPWLASTEIHQKNIKNATKNISDLGLLNSSAKIAPKDSVLIALAGQGKTRGTAAILEKDMAINQSLAALVCNEDNYYKFLFYAIEMNYESLRELSSGDGGRGGLNKKLIKDFKINIPVDKNEQIAIANILSSMDKDIENLEKEKEKYQQLKTGAMDDLLTGKIRLV